MDPRENPERDSVEDLDNVWDSEALENCGEVDVMA